MSNLKLFNSFSLHLLAMLFMLCDHLWGSILYQYDFLTYLGRLAFPLFAYLIVEGYHHTSNRKKYMQRLFIFALISEIPFNLFYAQSFIYPFHQNVLFTFVLVLCLFNLYEKIKDKKIIFQVFAYPLITFLFYLLGFVCFVDYFGYGILMCVLFYFTRFKKEDSLKIKVLKALIQVFGLYYISTELVKGLVISVQIFNQSFEIYKQSISLLSLPFIWLYNGLQGPYNQTIKYLYYSFYPLHLLILGLLIRL